MERSPVSSQLPRALLTDTPSKSDSFPQMSPSAYSYQPTKAELIQEWLKPYGIDIRNCDCCRRGENGKSSSSEESSPEKSSNTKNFEALLDKIIQETILECEEEERLARKIKEAVPELIIKPRAVVKVQRESVKRKLFPEIQPHQAVKRPMKTVSLGAPSGLYPFETPDIQANLVRLAEEQSRNWATQRNNQMTGGIC